MLNKPCVCKTTFSQSHFRECFPGLHHTHITSQHRERQIFQRQIVQNGGQTESSLCPTVTHVVVDDSMDCDRALRLLKVDRLPSGVYLLKCTWLSTCISEQRLLDTADYSLLNPDKDMETTKDGVKEDVLNKIPLPATQDMKQPISDETKPDESTETLG